MHSVKYIYQFLFIVHNRRQKGRDRRDEHRRINMWETEENRLRKTDRGKRQRGEKEGKVQKRRDRG